MSGPSVSSREYGVPERIRTDNGAPFSGTGILGLSRLSLEGQRLGICHERIQPGKPQQNGRHERMHRTVKQDTTNPSVKTIRAQQKRFNDFRRIYNYERPHEALNHETPGDLYAPSSRLLPLYTKAYVYPSDFHTRRVNDAGDISWAKSRVFISEVFRGEDIGLEKIEDNFYRIYFGSLEVVSSMPTISASVLGFVRNLVVGWKTIRAAFHLALIQGDAHRQSRLAIGVTNLTARTRPSTSSLKENSCGPPSTKKCSGRSVYTCSGTFSAGISTAIPKPEGTNLIGPKLPRYFSVVEVSKR